MTTKDREPSINIINAKVERSVLCVAIGQVTVNVTVTITRSAVRGHGACLRRMALAVLLAAVAVVLPGQVLAMNTPCSGKKGGVSHCAVGKFV
ncbi:MAG: hypothetical protein K2X51_12560 [Burkholderiales bacterium]|nr:hypothetical protein [Burkholderiales bacterium]